MRLGIESGHFFRVLDVYFLWLGIIVVFFLLRKKIKTEWFYFCLTFFIGAFIGLNIQLIIGFNPQPDHWMRKVIYFILTYMFFTISYVLICKLKKMHKQTIIASLILLIFIFASVWQIEFFEMRKPSLSLPYEEIEVYDWLNNKENISVVLTDDIVMNYHIPFYTKHDIFFPQGAFTILTNKEIINRTLKTYALLNYSDDKLESLLDNDQKIYKNNKELIEDLNSGVHENFYKTSIHMDILGMNYTKKGWFFKGFEEMNVYFNKEDLNKFMTEYQKMRINNTIYLPEKIDYIITKQNLNNKTPFKNIDIKEKFKNKRYFIYEVKKLNK
ncbi:hypothetical protein HZA97_03355 [Candidatus Woesearchaeota archaeon]|nr:hypothetical protein [Candidatus Woesearchaeota archaeon]